jgi:ABC-2 type transport system permease protein
VSEARILDRGYRRYDGPRLGPRAAMRSLAVQTIQRALGLRRSAWSKVVPFGTVVLAYLPAIVFVGIAVFANDQIGARLRLPSYGQYYGFVSAAILVFAAFVAPEVLCTDRRTGMLGLYLASPLTRTTYLLGKLLAVLAVLALVTLGPPLFMLVAYTLNGRGPDGPVAWLTLFGRMVVAGLAVALAAALLSLAISSLTARKAVAAAGVIFVLVGSAGVSDALIRSGGASANLFLVDLLQLPLELVFRIYGERFHVDSPAAASIPTSTLAAAYAGWCVLFGGIVWIRYRRLVVTK